MATKKETVAADVTEATEVAATQAEQVDYYELVEIKLFKDNDKYSNDVFVSVNGNNFLIKRGETVTVPRYIKEVLENSEQQARRAEEYSTEGWKQNLIKQD